MMQHAGAFIPLIEYHLANPQKSLRIVTDVGPFKRLLCELPITIIEILGPDFTQGTIHDDKSLNRQREPGEIALKGYDTFNSEFYFEDFFPKPPRNTITRILEFFARTVPAYIKLLPTYRILLVQRGQDKYYENGCRDRTSVYQTAGSDRRSIANHGALAAALVDKYGPACVSNIILEQSSIYYQYHMFFNAQVVIAQHGASLANIFFMSHTNGTPALPQKHIIEISPPWSRQYAHFRNLADFSRVAHVSIEQEQDHSAVDIDRVMDAVKNALQATDTAVEGSAGVRAASHNHTDTVSAAHTE